MSDYRKCPYCQRYIPPDYDFSDHKAICRNVHATQREMSNRVTAKDVVHEWQDDGIMTEDKAIKLVKEYALSVAREAVEVEKEEEILQNGDYMAILALDRLLTRIEKITETEES